MTRSLPRFDDNTDAQQLSGINFSSTVSFVFLCLLFIPLMAEIKMFLFHYCKG